MATAKPLSRTRLWRRTRIIATLGPATSKRATIEQLMRAGVNVIRLNLSHGSHDEHRKSFARVRAVAKKLDLHVAILMDLCGPKIRVGHFKNGAITLKQKQIITVTTRECIGEGSLIPSRYARLHRDVKSGARILLDDGNLELKVLSVEGRDVKCRVVTGGLLKDNKGMNLPDSDLSVPALTKKDREDAKLAAELGADYLALSFVRSAGDIRSLKKHLKRLGNEIPVVAKIERPEAVEQIDKIIEATDAIMVARGDLGIELPASKVPLIQDRLIEIARNKQKPVIVATQMLESMITNPRPTRAEVGDVAHAARSRADAVMLSGETAVGAYPLKAVQTMDEILREIEQSQRCQDHHNDQPIKHDHHDDSPMRAAVSHAVTSLSRDLDLQAIIIPTHSGTTARVLSADRPTSACLGVSSNERVVRRLALHWGIVPVQIDEDEAHDWHKLSRTIAARFKIQKRGSVVLLVSGFSDDPQLNEPAMKLITL
ncbi:pyruvate kinase [Solemya pervernicosa gill symbiont]|uniref:Pyruvate kinase n=2 Tax=Gammaproteobacteria incertae sedis TaxID=118884 RepID=A0A1T2L532_9GAMM|nr:pyruvate kinase [Candidatus Reidiella endopervernicosa]OOZ40174.1 pyruvate kinase [Solemya pervernicosa gill symbiont]QKQ25115.1 pyruvate kinase [Candidatus Reidiella endopervernicosa]